jgi:hypothetical protein
MAKQPLLLTGLALALHLKKQASYSSGLVKIKVSGFLLDMFLEKSSFLDSKGEPTTDPEQAVNVVCEHTGSYSKHTTYTPVFTLGVEVQEYPSQAHKNHNVTIASLDKADDDEDEGEGSDNTNENENN